MRESTSSYGNGQGGAAHYAGLFFWLLRTPEQKTHEGLLRGLLYCILAEDPTLIPSLLPGMWRDANRDNGSFIDIPSLAEMRNAFTGLTNSTMKIKICFFIDGLDEYFGNPIDGVQFIKDLASNRNIKVLVSSRPIPACHQAFSMKKHLQLQDLTLPDIKAYVDDTIGRHPYLRSLRSMDPVGTDEIMLDVVKKSSGVFPWVVLACRSLLEGFTAFDNPGELRNRVKSLPPELEQLFEHILKRIEPRYREQAAKLLRICCENQVSLAAGTPKRSPTVISSDDKEMYTIGLALADEYELGMEKCHEFAPLSLAQRRMKCEVLEARLRSRCCGLLEIRLAHIPADYCFCGHIGQTGKLLIDPKVDSKVEFMHRSVFDFLNSPGIWSLGVLQITDSNFDTNVILARMLRWVKSVAFREEMLLRVRKVGHAFCTAAVAILLEFSSFTLQVAMEISCRERFYGRGEYSKSSVMYLSLALAIELGMDKVVEFWASKGSLNAMEETFPLLYHATDKPYTNAYKSFSLDLSPYMVRLLLDKGANPNARFAVEGSFIITPWMNWLNHSAYSSPLEEAVEITRLFIKAGADLDRSQNELSKIINELLSRGLTDIVTVIRQGHIQVIQTSRQKIEKRPFEDNNDSEDSEPQKISGYPHKRAKVRIEVEVGGTEESGSPSRSS
ncbi:hypothetical protein PG994_006402 [Apiospora phragmitis]|uniref:Uncharacterized protein n=1 Tax=Apiospora phragmitis TaxID=2905665 RepID=A0ABR1VHK2_9PEZI